jgi:hypothetical protein
LINVSSLSQIQLLAEDGNYPLRQLARILGLDCREDDSLKAERKKSAVRIQYILTSRSGAMATKRKREPIDL